MTVDTRGQGSDQSASGWNLGGAAPTAWNQIMGAGDIDADPAGTTTADRATSEIMIQANPATVSTAGDGQHPYGTIETYTDPNGYASSWGRPALKSKTYPAVGDHDYYDPLPGPAGYRAYFSPPCPHRPDIEYARTSGGSIIPTVYADRPAPGSGWWAYVLDRQCTHAEDRGPSCSRYSNQLNWFRAPISAHPVRCRVVSGNIPDSAGNGAPFRGRQPGVLALYRSRLPRPGQPGHQRPQTRLRTLHLHDP